MAVRFTMVNSRYARSPLFARSAKRALRRAGSGSLKKLDGQLPERNDGLGRKRHRPRRSRNNRPVPGCLLPCQAPGVGSHRRGHLAEPADRSPTSATEQQESGRIRAHRRQSLEMQLVALRAPDHGRFALAQKRRNPRASRSFLKGEREDSNARPPGPQAAALVAGLWGGRWWFAGLSRRGRRVRRAREWRRIGVNCCGFGGIQALIALSARSNRVPPRLGCALNER